MKDLFLPNDRQIVLNGIKTYEREEGRKEGLEQGRQEKVQEIAHKLLEQGADIKMISLVTGLSEAAIKELDNNSYQA